MFPGFEEEEVIPKKVRYFTLEQANETLPFVRRVVSDIVDAYRKWKEKIYRFELVAAESDAAKESEEQATLREEIDGIAQRINRFVAELEPVGCVLKGFDDGLIDFYSKMDGGDVFLCWKLGEDTIEHWHELDVGFAGRQPFVSSAGKEGG